MIREKGSGRKIAFRNRLWAELIISVAIAMAAAVLCFAAIRNTAYDWLDRTQSTYEAYHLRQQRSEERLQKYIDEKKISLSDLSPLDSWVKEEEYVTLMIYQGGRLVYSSYPVQLDEQSVKAETDPLPEPDTLSDPYLISVPDSGAYEASFADGTAQALVLPFYEYRYYQWADGAAAFCGFLLFMTIFLLLIRRKTSYIELLKKELLILEGGQMEYKISVKGSDELGELAEGINRMRISILEREEKEAEARRANQELVTAMSHDLRSPLTSLLGYLELLEGEEVDDAAQQKHFIATSRKKAMQIKEMSDRLFEYFLVYGREEKPATELVEGAVLFQQTIGESAFALENRGFMVDFQMDEMEGVYSVSVNLFCRVADNLFSNALKYADRNQTVTITCVETKAGASVTFRNGIRKDGVLTESSGIGLKTCEKIMKEHGGSFKVESDGDTFAASLFLPGA